EEANTEEIKDIIKYNFLPLEYSAQSMVQLYPQIFEWLSLVDVNVYILLALMAGVAFISMTTALIVLIIERTPMIGMLKSLGATNTTIAGIFLFLSGRLIIGGIIIGNALALGLCWLQYQYKFFKLNQESYYMKWVPIRFPWESIIIINIATFVVCFISLTVPFFVIMRTSPMKSIKFA
ncbi:MAG: FtsX-like permease family protein, partial [Bacteroidetes bacterium]|nr:FtsX-like permease family protein [Bacteroidota bacterium]